MKMSNDSSLTDKDQELIALGASIASGCQPCTKYHFRAAGISGADDDETNRAVNLALYVRRRATAVMAELAGNRPGDPASSDAVSGDTQSLLDELIAVSAAYALNCVTSLETHLAAAREQGATGEQILTTLKIACAVKDMAGKKVKDAAARLWGGSEARGEECGCQDGTESAGEAVQAEGANVTARPGNSTAQCGCHN